MLQEADMVVYVGEGIEEFLEKPLESISKNSVKFELMNQSGIKKLKFRERNIFGDHDDHDDHGHGKKKKMIMTIMMIMIRKLKKKITMTTMITIMIKKLKKMIMMITDMTTMDTDMVSLIHTSG